MNMTAQCVKTYILRVDDNGEIIGNNNASDDPGEALDHKAKSYAAEHRVDYQTALDAVMADPDHADLVHAYSSPPVTLEYVAPPGVTSWTVSEEVNLHAMEKIEEDPTLSLVQAVELVLEEDPKLKIAYAASAGVGKIRLA